MPEFKFDLRLTREILGREFQPILDQALERAAQELEQRQCLRNAISEALTVPARNPARDGIMCVDCRQSLDLNGGHVVRHRETLGAPDYAHLPGACPPRPQSQVRCWWCGLNLNTTTQAFFAATAQHFYHRECAEHLGLVRRQDSSCPSLGPG